MPGVAALEETAWDAKHHGGGETVVRPPAHRPAIVDLLGRGLGIFAKLDFGHGHEAGERHPDGPSDDAFFVEGGIKHSVAAKPLLQAKRHSMDAALGAHVLAEDEHPRIGLELLLKDPSDGGDHVDALAFGSWLLGRGVDAQPRVASNLLH